MGSHWDFIVIGSGVSGGRMALELQRSGAKTLLLEAGKHFKRDTFPGDELDYSSQLFWGGGVELAKDARLGFLRAKCVGGTSVVNQALMDRFDENAWSDWRDRSGVAGLSAKTFEPYYDSILQTLPHKKLDASDRNPNAEIFCKGLERVGVKWKALTRAQAGCDTQSGNDCMVCLGGCPRDSKQSSLVTAIPEFLRLGGELRSETEVTRIGRNAADAWVETAKKERLLSRGVVLAAGSFGTVGILLRSGMQKQLPALGNGFTCHPQIMTYAWMGGDKVDAHKGAFQTVASSDPDLRRRGIKLENVFAGPIGTSILIPGLGLNHLRHMKKYRELASIEVCIRDEPTGKIRVGSGRKLVVDKPMTDQDRARVRDGMELVRSIFAQAGAKEIISCSQAFGLHLMGGAAIGVEPSTSVVNPNFQVHGMENIWIADSSVFPSAPGINPSLTIMAMGIHTAEKMVQR